MANTEKIEQMGSFLSLLDGAEAVAVIGDGDMATVAIWNGSATVNIVGIADGEVIGFDVYTNYGYADKDAEFVIEAMSERLGAEYGLTEDSEEN